MLLKIRIILHVANRLRYYIYKEKYINNLVSCPQVDVIINGESSPMMVATQYTSASLARCYGGEQRTVSYPEWI